MKFEPARRLALAGLLVSCATVIHADTETGLIAHYAFDGNAQDSSPNNNHGAPGATMVATTDRFGTPSGAYEFNGTSSYITVPNSASLASPSSAITMAVWILLYGSSKVGSDFSPILMKSATGENGFMYRMNAHPTYFGSAYNSWTTHQSGPATLPNTEWHHVASTFDGTRHRFYLDGVQVSDQALALTITPDTRPLLIGADTPGVLEVFWGKMDDMRIYARALSAEDIAELYALTPVGAGKKPAAARFAIRQVLPNPSGGSSGGGGGDVSLQFELPASAAVELEVLDPLGRRVRSVSLGVWPGGTHVVQWDGRTNSGGRAAAGIYFVRLHSAGAAAVARVVRVE